MSHHVTWCNPHTPSILTLGPIFALEKSNTRRALIRIRTLAIETTTPIPPKSILAQSETEADEGGIDR